MDILIACEESQEVCKALRAKGHAAYSCDIIECSGGYPEWHIHGDAVKALYSKYWDLVIAHPPCTKLSNSGVRWFASRSPRTGYEWSSEYSVYLSTDQSLWKAFESGVSLFLEFVKYGESGNKIGIEKPIQHRYARERIPEYSQIINPYQFGHTEQKQTCLWLYNLPQLVETNNVYAEMIKLPYADRAKIHYASPGKDRGKLRSKTYPGIAQAMADQWG